MQAFFNDADLKGWWQVDARVHRAAAARHVCDRVGLHRVQGRVLGRLGGAIHGKVIDFRPNASFFLADVYWQPPDGDPIGPMALEVQCRPHGNGRQTMLTVKQSGEGEGPRFERYFSIMNRGWEGALERDEGLHRSRNRADQGGARIAHTDGMTRKVTGLITSLTLWDVVAMNIVAVVGLRWISRSARLGAPSVTLWILACLLFFVPLAAVIAELSSRHPEQGGIYAWARRAFGPAHGFICGWCMWVNNLFYFPALLLFAAANAAGAARRRRRGDRRQPARIRSRSCSASCG